MALMQQCQTCIMVYICLRYVNGLYVNGQIVLCII